MDYIMPFNTPWFWFFLAVVFVIIEGLTFSLTTVWFAIGALVLVFLSFIPLPFVVQLLIFLAVSIVLLVLTRPVALKKLHLRREKTNVDRFVGMHAIVTKRITAFDKGEIKVGGVVWTAKTSHDTPLEEGIECIVVRIEGVTAIVEPKTAETE